MSDVAQAATIDRGRLAASVAAVAAVGLLLSWSGAATAAPAGQDEFGRVQVDQAEPYGLLGGGWRHQRSYGYQGPAGVYSCAQGRVDTNLARKACGGAKFPNRFF